MTYEAEHHVRSVIVGDLKLPPRGHGGRRSRRGRPGRESSHAHRAQPAVPGWPGSGPAGASTSCGADFADRAGGSWPADPASAGPVQPAVPPRLALVAPKLYQCVLSRADAQEMVGQDRRSARQSGRPPVIFRVWPDYTLDPQIDRSAPTVKADAAWRSYDARGRGIVWAVIDSGIDACHPHFSALELAAEGRGDPAAAGPDQSAAPRFQLPGQPGRPAAGGRPPRRPGDRPCPTRAGTALTSPASSPAVHRTAPVRWSRTPRSRWTAGMSSGHASAGCPAWRRPASW